MAITTIGFDGPVTEAQWATLQNGFNGLNNSQGVLSGMDVSPGGSSRQVSIAAGEGGASGVWVSSTSATTLTLAANATGATRRDYVVLRLDWTANTAVFAAITGSSGASPSLTQNAGSLWEIPLATVDVANGKTGTFATSDLIARKPVPRVSRFFKATTFTYRTGVGYTSAPVSVATVAPGDPGWPYVLRCDAAAVFATGGSGAGTVQVALTGATSPFLVGRSDPLNSTATAGHPARVSGVSDVQTGVHGVVFNVQPADLVAGDTLSMISGSATMFHVEQIPA